MISNKYLLQESYNRLELSKKRRRSIAISHRVRGNLKILAQFAAITHNLLGGSVGIINTHGSDKHRADLGGLVAIFRLANNFSSAGEVDEAKGKDDSKKSLGHLGKVGILIINKLKIIFLKGTERL